MRLEVINTVAVPGFINGLDMSDDGSLLVACVGQEHRLGRWTRNATAKNGIVVVRLLQQNDKLSDEDYVEERDLGYDEVSSEEDDDDNDNKFFV